MEAAVKILNNRTPCCNRGVKHRTLGPHRVDCPRCDTSFDLVIAPASDVLQAKLGKEAAFCHWERVS